MARLALRAVAFLFGALVFQGSIAAAADLERLRIATVGLVHPHAGAVLDLLKRPDVEVVGICESSAEALELFERAVGRRLDRKIVYSSEAAMLEQAHPQAIIAFTTTYDHAEVVEVAARHGVHVMVEKPLAVSNEHALRIARAAAAGKIQVLTNFATTWHPNNTAIHRALHDGSIGEARKFVVHDGHNAPRPVTGPFGWLADARLNGGGALFDFGCYGANLVTWMMDGRRPTSVTCVTQTVKPDVYTQVDDEATIVLTYPKAQAILQASWNWPFDRKDIEVYGETGQALSVRTDAVRLRLKGENEERLVAAPALARPNDDFVNLLRAVVNGLPPPAPTDLATNLIATEILDAARESARTGKTINLPASASDGTK